MTKRKTVWLVYNSGDPIWDGEPFKLFASKHGALGFVRLLLIREWKIYEAANFDDATTKKMMWTNGPPQRYLHLYELPVH